jgi:hypothetical protein
MARGAGFRDRDDEKFINLIVATATCGGDHARASLRHQTAFKPFGVLEVTKPEVIVGVPPPAIHSPPASRR